MAEWLGNGLQNHAQQFDSAWHLENHAQQFDSAWHLDLLVISFSVINYVVSMSGPRVSGGDSFFLYKAFSQEHFPVYLGFLVQREGVSPG